MGGHSFHGTANAMSLWQPAIVPCAFQNYGISLGLEQITNRRVWLWPYSLNPNAPLIRFEGLRGAGKSATMKDISVKLQICHALDVRQNVEALRTRYSSRKSEQGIGEYDPVLAALSAQSYDLSERKINLYGFFTRESEVSVMSIMLGKHLAGGVLPVEVRVAIMTAVHKMYILAEAKPHPAVVERLLRRLQLRDFDLFYREGDNFLEDLLEEEIKLNPNLREELGIDHRALAEAARDFIGPVSDPSKAPASDFELRHLKASRIAADLFFNLVTGYGGVFSGSDSLYDVLSQDVVGLDWEKLAEGADDILESVMMMAEAGAIAYARKGSEKALDLTRTIPHATYSDEEGKAMEGEMHTTAKANRIRTRRASHGVDFEAVQYEIQTKNVGGVGTAHRSHAEEIELGVGARIIFKQPEDETFLHDHFSRRGISDQYVARLPKLEEGQAMLYVPGKKPLFYNHVLSPSIAPLTRTVAAREQMNTHVPLTQQKGWAERMARMENVMIGLDQSDHG